MALMSELGSNATEHLAPLLVLTLARLGGGPLNIFGPTQLQYLLDQLLLT